MGDERGGIYLALRYQIQNLITVAAIHSLMLIPCSCSFIT